MCRPRVYVETTIPNFYYGQRTGAAAIERRDWTRRWWDGSAGRYELVTGVPVLAELLAGMRTPRVDLRVRLVGLLPLLVPDTAVVQTVEAYIRDRLMPARPSADAEHLALASHHRCDFIVTWNCRHLANPNKTQHVRRVNARLGLHVPAIVTPRDLLGRTG